MNQNATIEGPTIFLIAGEASGDLLGAQLMKSLRKTDANVKFQGIGGEKMMEEGLLSLFPMEDLSVMGIAEVLPKIPLLLGRIDETTKHILRLAPDAVVTIDAPDFSLRVMKRLKKNGYRGCQIHYVAPSVWAWRPKRAKKIAKFLDRVLCLLPFEPPYFKKEGLEADFVGHSMIEQPAKGQASLFRKMHNIQDEKRIVLLLPGSRKSEVKRHLDLFLKSGETLDAIHQNLIFVIPTLPHLKQDIVKSTGSVGCQVLVIDNEDDKKNAFDAAEMALAASGTVALELALADVPSVISYRMNPVTGWIAKRVVKTKYVALPNIILGEEVMPELLLKDANLENIVNVMDCFLSNETLKNAQSDKFRKILQQISPPNGLKPSEKAADVILQEIKHV